MKGFRGKGFQVLHLRQEKKRKKQNLLLAEPVSDLPLHGREISTVGGKKSPGQRRSLKKKMV